MLTTIFSKNHIYLMSKIKNMKLIQEALTSQVEPNVVLASRQAL